MQILEFLRNARTRNFYSCTSQKPTHFTLSHREVLGRNILSGHRNSVLYPHIPINLPNILPPTSTIYRDQLICKPVRLHDVGANRNLGEFQTGSKEEANMVTANSTQTAFEVRVGGAVRQHCYQLHTVPPQ